MSNRCTVRDGHETNVANCTRSWLRTVFESAPDAYFVYDLDATLLDGNAATEELTGYSRAELLHKKIWEANLVPPGELDKVKLSLLRNTAGESTGPTEYTLVRKDGKTMPVEIRTFPTEMQGRRIVVGCLRDIRDRKRLEQDRLARLQRTHRLHAAVLEIATHESVVSGDLEHAARCLTKQLAESLNLESASVWLRHGSSDEMIRLVEYDARQDRYRSEVEAQPFGPAVFHPRHPVVSKIGPSGGWPEITRLEVPIQISGATTGLVRHERLRGDEPNAWESEEIRFAAEMGHLIAIAILNHDRQEALNALRRSEAWLGRAQRMASLCNWEVDLRSDSLQCSAEMFRIFGLEPGSEPINFRDFLDLVHPDDRPTVEESTREVIRTGKPAEIELRITRPDGSQRFLREHAEVEFDFEGKPLRAHGTLQDITEYKELERRSLAAHRMETVGRLAGGVAHDFNNLLTVINGYSEMLLRRMPANDSFRLKVMEIRKAGAKAAELTGQLLAFSRKQVVQPQKLDLNEVVREIESMLRQVIGEHIDLHAILSSAPALVEADQGQIQQVLMNLVVNARDAMPHGGRVLIETSSVDIGEPAGERNPTPAGRYVLLAVSDSGAGMDEETRTRVFEPFFTTKAQGRGTGLGMATVYGIVKQSGGWIWVYSEPGMGTTIKVYLPRVDRANTSPGTTDSDVAPSLAELRGNETILLVEDQDEVRQVTGALLEEQGYHVLAAANGAEALEHCRTYPGRIDLTVTDMVMPGCSGLQLAERLRESYPHIKLLFMSGYTENAAALQEGLPSRQPLLQKPFAPQTLAQHVRQCLGPARQPTILVVDDEPSIRFLLRDILSEDGFRVVLAANGKEAMDLVSTGIVDLVLTDLVMPEQEGIETIIQIRKQMPWIPMIAMSGAFGGDCLSAAKMLGAFATVLKPIDPLVLLPLIRSGLQSRPNSSSAIHSYLRDTK